MDYNSPLTDKINAIVISQLGPEVMYEEEDWVDLDAVAREPAMLTTEPRGEAIFDRASDLTTKGIVEAPIMNEALQPTERPQESDIDWEVLDQDFSIEPQDLSANPVGRNPASDPLVNDYVLGSVFDQYKDRSDEEIKEAYRRRSNNPILSPKNLDQYNNALKNLFDWDIKILSGDEKSVKKNVKKHVIDRIIEEYPDADEEELSMMYERAKQYMKDNESSLLKMVIEGDFAPIADNEWVDLEEIDREPAGNDKTGNGE